jgi:hypothetical protein
MIPIHNIMIAPLPSSKRIIVDHDELVDAINGIFGDKVIFFRYESEIIRVEYFGDSVMCDSKDSKGRVGLSISESEEMDGWGKQLTPEKLLEMGNMPVYNVGPVQFILKLPVTLERCLEAAAGLVVENIHSQ